MLWRLLRSAFGSQANASQLVQRALKLRASGRHSEAEGILRAAVRGYPHDAAATTNLAVALLERDCLDEAVPLLEKALQIDPRFAAAHFNYAHLLRSSGRVSEAIDHYEAAVDSEPSFAPAHEALMQARLEACDWDGAERIMAALNGRISREPRQGWLPFVSPTTAMCLGLDADEFRAVAAFHAPPALARAQALIRPHAPRKGRRLRIAYLSRDFRDHAVGQMLGNALASHDRGRYEVHAYSFGVDDGSTYRAQVRDSVERFVDIAHMNDDEAAAAIAGARIDVLIDLMGHTTGHRLGILARRCAPAQTHFLGYPGTTGAPYVDYFVGDAIASPPELDARFSERVVRVPDCYMLTDLSYATASGPAQRSANGLPEDRFVFCNFGSSTRIDRRSFVLWMRILAAVPHTLLWLLTPAQAAIDNMKREAARCGVNPERLVFGAKKEKKAHLARLACTDVALDTLGWYNAHSTGADLLWAGVPLVTSPGETFATRVAASLVSSAGLPELAVQGDDAYCALAIALAKNAARAAELKKRLRAARAYAPLFDTARLVRGLEGAYEAMYAAKMPPPSGL